MRNCIVYYKKVKASDLQALCAGVITSLTGNANFPNLPTELSEMIARNAALQSAMNDAVDSGRTKLATLRQIKEVVAIMLHNTASYVNLVSNGDVIKMMSSGLMLSKTPENHDIPAQVVNLKALYTNTTGKINLIWKKSLYARIYNVFASADDGITWNMINATCTRRLICESLISGKRYSFKVIALNQLGKAPESNVASQLAA